MTTLLILLVVAFGVMAIAQLARVYELTARLRGKKEEEISDSDNRMNGRLMWVFCVAYFAFFLWLLFHYTDKLLPVAASEHGVWLDNLLNFNWLILIVVFFITNILLFYFAGKYYHRRDRKAHWYPHNNKWEVAWTVVPAIVMMGIIVYGLITWNRIMKPASPDALKVEIYAKQFDWTMRYPGPDGILGATDYRLINDNNPLGIVTASSIATRLKELEAERYEIGGRLATEVLAPGKREELEIRVEHLERMSARIIHLRTLMQQDIDANGEGSAFKHGGDDIVIKEFHLPVRKEAQLVIRSRDVIHSVYLPHLRMQMNAVPGMTTTFHMVPTITTDSMRLVTADPAFDFILLCNKICGASHYNMQMPLIVEDQGTYDAWMAEQVKKPFEAPAAAAAPPATPPATDSTQVTEPVQTAALSTTTTTN